MFQHGNETCENMRISCEIDRQKRQYLIQERYFDNCKLRFIVFNDDKMVDINSSIESNSIQIYQ